MSTITVRLDDEFEAKVRRRLAHSGKTLSDFAREAMAEKLEAEPQITSRFEAWQRAAERLTDDGGATDVSSTYKARIKEKLSAKYSR